MQIGGSPSSLIFPATSVAYGCLPMLRRTLLGRTGGVAVEKTDVGTQRCEGCRCTMLQWTVDTVKSTGEDCFWLPLLWKSRDLACRYVTKLGRLVKSALCDRAP